MILDQIPEHIIKPSLLLESKNFLVKIAENPEEIEAAQKLRFKVFNLEQGKGLKNSSKFEIDIDEFDDYCLHLIVFDKKRKKVIGTYRAHLGYIAKQSHGFYSSREYNIKDLDKLADQSIELGRSCVSPEYRTGSVVSLLWSAISVLMMRTNLVYMIGCVSLEETDPAVGWAIYEYIREQYPAQQKQLAEPKPEFKLPKPPEQEKEQILDDPLIESYIPPLFKGYLRLGAYICGEPALDKEFGTIDYFILVDIRKVPEKYIKFFHYIRPKTEQ